MLLELILLLGALHILTRRSDARWEELRKQEQLSRDLKKLNEELDELVLLEEEGLLCA